jgi:NAD(P)H-dependent flavin oxidoreductase YrpB (nitropropane dioxygenase family)
VDGATREHHVAIDPHALGGDTLPAPRRPTFLAIVSAHVLAAYLARDDATRPDGFVVEGPTAGGHNAPPRGRLVLDETGQPVFGPRDIADLAKVSEVGLPFWVAGGQGTPEGVAEALAAGAAGVQVGTLFALARESGIAPALRQQLLERMGAGILDVRTDGMASPTGFPFKVTRLPGTGSEPEVYEARPRLCDLGYLRVPYERPNGAVGYRCPAEPVDAYVRKGGKVEDTVGRACLCNALTADIGLGQTRKDGYQEVPIVTLGTDLDGPRRLLDRHPAGWDADQALAFLLGSSDR